MRPFLSLAFCLLLTNTDAQHAFNGVYKKDNAERIAFPIGGMGAGMFCLEGTGAVSHMSVRNSPDIFNEPVMFAALSIKGIKGSAKVLEGPVPGWKKFGQKGDGLGAAGSSFGLARFRDARFSARFPFGEVQLTDSRLPVSVSIIGW